MARIKQAKFAHNLEAQNVVQEGKENWIDIAGNWNKKIFKNNNPITLEIGCGHGDYTLGLARLYPNRNFIGVDVKGTRIAKGSKIAMDEGLSNVAFLRIRIHDLADRFEDGEVEAFWITFPDPRPRDRDERRRLVFPRFLNVYREISCKNTIVNLKTDNFDFYDYSLTVCQSENLEVIAQTDDLYQSEHLSLCHNIQTTYEKRYLDEGKKINYLKFKL